MEKKEQGTSSTKPGQICVAERLKREQIRYEQTAFKKFYSFASKMEKMELACGHDLTYITF